MKKRAPIYARVSTSDEHAETQFLDLREMAKQGGYEIVHVNWAIFPQFCPVWRLSKEQMSEVNRQALESLREYSTNSGMSFPAEVLIVSGAKSCPA